jgi:hypothetical protein
VRSIPAAASACAIVVGIAGCSSPRPGAVAAVTTTHPASPAATTAATSPSASGLGVALGKPQSATALSVTIKATAVSYRVITLTSANEELLPSGTKVALIQATGCVTANGSGDEIGLTWSPWTLVTSTGATVEAIGAHGTSDFPGSLYPDDSTVATPTGRCRSGLIPFSLAGVSGTPAAVEYNVHGIVLDWAVS